MNLQAPNPVGHLLPENAILIDEAITSLGPMLGVMTAGCPRHDLITL